MALFLAVSVKQSSSSTLIRPANHYIGSSAIATVAQEADLNIV